jgi:hypothetical protein
MRHTNSYAFKIAGQQHHFNAYLFIVSVFISSLFIDNHVTNVRVKAFFARNRSSCADTTISQSTVNHF